jgi:hypothetical protein
MSSSGCVRSPLAVSHILGAAQSPPAVVQAEAARERVAGVLYTMAGEVHDRCGSIRRWALLLSDACNRVHLRLDMVQPWERGVAGDLRGERASRTLWAMLEDAATGGRSTAVAVGVEEETT